MSRWTSSELDKIGTAEELEIASVRRGGTLRKPVTIWVVRYVGANQVRVASGSYAPSAASSTESQTITITRSGSQPSRQAPAEYFTGSVRIDPLFETKDPSHTSGSYVTFEPGARSAWHTHPLGQTLIVTAGTARVQRWGDSVEEIRPGDVVWIPPGQKHWHGASPTTA